MRSDKLNKFNIIPNRKNTRSVKWDTVQDVFNSEDVLPMWVADMDFKAPEEVNNALIDRAKHGIYGYTIIDTNIKTAIQQWLSKQFNWHIKQEWLSFSPGVVTSLHMAVQSFTKPGDKILIQTPVYPPFYKVVENHDRQLVKNPLLKKDDHYEIDFDDFQKKIEQGVKAFILCSPHNPVGRVWTKKELQKMADICVENDVIIVSDEIHSDLVFKDYKHTPIASLSNDISQKTITCMAPSKTFNLAGLQASYVVTQNEQMKMVLDQTFGKQGVGMLNAMGSTALEAAYEYGEQWLNDLLVVLNDHQTYVIEMFKEHIPNVKVIPAEGTYLLWIDFSGLGMNDNDLQAFLINEAKVGLNSGVSYGEEGKHFMRMNIGCPKDTLIKGVTQIINAVKQI